MVSRTGFIDDGITVDYASQGEEESRGCLNKSKRVQLLHKCRYDPSHLRAISDPPSLEGMSALTSSTTCLCFGRRKRYTLWTRGTEVFSHLIDLIGTSGWRSSWLAFGWSTGNNIRGHCKQHYFLLVFFSPLSTYLIEGVLGWKNLFSKKWWERLGVDTFPELVIHFGAPSRPFWILQVVRHCRWCPRRR